LIFNNDKKQEQRQTQGNIQNDVPTTFRKKELTEDQRDSLREGKTVYTGDLLDKKGQKYSGYITLNKETGKLDFMFPKDYKEALAAEKVIPDNRHKPQVAKNNKGETTETNKHVNEPFKSGQTQPTETQQQEKEKKQVKPTGRKMS
jgi:hypothetical protein